MSLLGATIGLITGNQQAKAAEGAANAQKKAASAATQVERERLQMEYQQYQQQMQEYQRRQAINEQQMAQTIQNLAPYMQGGQAALYEMMALTGMAAPAGATAPTTTSIPMAGLRGTTQPAATAPTTTGRMGILGGLTGTVAPVQAMSPAAMEFEKGGQTLSSSRLASAATYPNASPRAIAAQMYQQVKSEMPGATETDIKSEAINRLNSQYNVEQAQASLPTVEAATSPYAGMTGAEAQKTAMGGLAASPYSYQSLSSAEGLQQIAESPLLQALAQQGETGILQNAAATGGLRGGRTQAALAQFRPQQMQEELMRRYTTGQSELANQYARLQGLSGLGQQSILAAPTTSAGAMPTYSGQSQIPQLLGQYGAAQAGGILGQAAPFTSAVNTAMQLAGTAGGLAMGLPGGAGTAAPAYAGLGIGNPSAYTF